MLGRQVRHPSRTQSRTNYRKNDVFHSPTVSRHLSLFSGKNAAVTALREMALQQPQTCGGLPNAALSSGFASRGSEVSCIQPRHSIHSADYSRCGSENEVEKARGARRPPGEDHEITLQVLLHSSNARRLSFHFPSAWVRRYGAFNPSPRTTPT